MKTIAAILLAGLTSLQAGEFINLNFDSGNPVNLIPNPPGSGNYVGETSDLLPGWTVMYGVTNISRVNYSTAAGGIVGVTIERLPQALTNTPHGRFEIQVNSRLILPGPIESGFPITISQTGHVPSDVVGLRYISGLSGPEVRIDGSLAATLSPGLVDLRQYAGTDITLSFGYRGGQGDSFDVIGFTNVPEPSTWALAGIGFAALVCLHQRKRE